MSSWKAIKCRSNCHQKPFKLTKSQTNLIQMSRVIIAHQYYLSLFAKLHHVAAVSRPFFPRWASLTLRLENDLNSERWRSKQNYRFSFITRTICSTFSRHIPQLKTCAKHRLVLVDESFPSLFPERKILFLKISFNKIFHLLSFKFYDLKVANRKSKPNFKLRDFPWLKPSQKWLI